MLPSGPSGNATMLEAMPKAVIACPGNGINANLVDKARKLGLKVWKVGAGGSLTAHFDNGRQT